MSGAEHAGYHAGFSGAALAIEDWAWQLVHGGGTPLPGKVRILMYKGLNHGTLSESTGSPPTFRRPSLRL